MMKCLFGGNDISVHVASPQLSCLPPADRVSRSWSHRHKPSWATQLNVEGLSAAIRSIISSILIVGLVVVVVVVVMVVLLLLLLLVVVVVVVIVVVDTLIEH